MDRLDLRLVQYFVAVAEELHFGRAAERLHIAQPSLSHQIRRLEEQLGVTLLDRTSRRVQLTEAGRALLADGRRLLAQADAVVRRTRAAGGEQLTIGFYGSAATVWLPRILRVFTEERPDVQLSIRDMRLGLIDDLLNGDVDIAFTRLIPGQGDLEIEVLATEPRVVALPAGHRLAGREEVEFGELRAESFITNPAVAGPSPPARWLREQIRHGLPGRVAGRASSLPEILALVAGGRGISLVPASVAEQNPRADVVYVPVTDAEPAVVSLARPRGTPSPAVRALIETARALAGG
jgi:DNA-binding transcriptional LysR family regulator